MCIRDSTKGEWTASLDKDTPRPDPVSTHTFTKFDHQRAIVFGGYGFKGRVNKVYIFDLDKRVRRLYVATCQQ